MSFKWIEGGQDSVEVTERQMVHATEPQHEVTTEIQIIDGRAVQVEKTITHTAHLYDTLPVHDADGNPVMVEVPARFQDPNNPVSQVQKMHRVERMVEADVKVIKTIPRPGKRTHLGFLATDLRDAFAQHWPGMDPGAYVQTEDGTHHSRPDQLIPILWKGLREALLRIESLEAKVEGMESGRTVAPSA